MCIRDRFLIVIVAIPHLRAAWRYDPRAPQNNAYYKASPETRIEYGAMYFGLAALLAIMTYTVHGMIQG